MEYVLVPHADLSISRIGFGCEQLGGFDWGIVDEKLAVAAVERALACGVNFFDTANVYGLGRSEELLSVALGPRRHDVVIATKCGLMATPNSSGARARTYVDSRPETISQSLEESLRRLRVDSIGVCFLHWPDPAVPLEESLGALERLRRAGKIRAVGLSNYSADLIRMANGIVPISVVESPYSLINRGAEREVFGCCQRLGIAVVAYGTLAQGLLTGKYMAGTSFGANDRRSRLPHFQGEAYLKNQTAVQGMKTLGARYGKTAAQTAIRWVLDHPAVSCALFGAKSPVQVEENLGAMGWRFQPGDYEWLSKQFHDQSAA